VPGLVLTEVDYFLRAERQAMRLFVQDLARGAFSMRRRPSGNSRAPWKSTGALPTSIWASSMHPWWH
jgi:hypothetical protein